MSIYQNELNATNITLIMAAGLALLLIGCGGGYKISFTGKFKGKDNKGRSFAASEKGTYWFALINGEPNMIKFVYQNTFPEKVVRELIAVEYK